MFVCLNPINVKTAKPIEFKFYIATHMTTEKVYECSELENLSQNFLYILKIFKIRENN